MELPPEIWCHITGYLDALTARDEAARLFALSKCQLGMYEDITVTLQRSSARLQELDIKCHIIKTRINNVAAKLRETTIVIPHHSSQRMHSKLSHLLDELGQMERIQTELSNDIKCCLRKMEICRHTHDEDDSSSVEIL